MQNLKHLAYDQLDGGRLRDHQAEGVAIMATTPKTVCADPVGAGKTVQAAGLIAYLKETGAIGPARPVLWLTQGDQLAHQTARELERFLPDLTIQNLAGHPAMSSSAKDDRRRQALAESADVKIMTYSGWNVRGHLWDWPLQTVILDEVSALKGGLKTYKAALTATANAERVHAFTATLYENHPLEVWHVYSLLHLPHLPAKPDFEAEYVAWRKFENGDSQPYAWRNEKVAGQFRDLTAAHFFRRDEALADLRRPECGRHQVWVPLSPHQQGAMSWAAGHLKGLRLANFQKEVVIGARSGPSTRATEASLLIGGLLEVDPTAKVLVIGEYVCELETVARELDRLNIAYVELRGGTKQRIRPTVVEDFRSDPNISVLVGSTVVERGLNLQFCSHLVSVGVSHNPADLDQGVGRIVRRGSPFPQVDHWVVLNDHEYERKAVERLARKEAQAALLRDERPEGQGQARLRGGAGRAAVRGRNFGGPPAYARTT